MTIEVHGHIHALENGHAVHVLGEMHGGVGVVLHLEASRTESPHRILIRASAEEVDSYRVGMPVIVQIRPAPKP